jgi:hypothetical protein
MSKCWFAVDFTLEELKTLKVKQRYSFRDQQYNGMDILRMDFVINLSSLFHVILPLLWPCWCAPTPKSIEVILVTSMCICWIDLLLPAYLLLTVTAINLAISWKIISFITRQPKYSDMFLCTVNNIPFFAKKNAVISECSNILGNQRNFVVLITQKCIACGSLVLFSITFLPIIWYNLGFLFVDLA